MESDLSKNDSSHQGQESAKMRMNQFMVFPTIIQVQGYIDFRMHRFLIVAQKV
jgi:hypothetical protein